MILSVNDERANNQPKVFGESEKRHTGIPTSACLFAIGTRPKHLEIGFPTPNSQGFLLKRRSTGRTKVRLQPMKTFSRNHGTKLPVEEVQSTRPACFCNHRALCETRSAGNKAIPGNRLAVSVFDHNLAPRNQQPNCSLS